MKVNRYLLLFVVALTIGIAYYMFTSGSSTIKKELRNFAVEDTASIDKIFLADKLGKVSLLERQSSGRWTVNGKYDARQDAVKTLLLTLNKMSVKSPVAKSMEANVLKDLAGPAQKKVEVYSKGRLIRTFYVGLETRDKMGTFMMLENSSVPFEVHIAGHRGFLQTRFITDENIWRDIVVFGYDERDIRSVNLTYNDEPANSFEIKFDGDETAVLEGMSDYDPRKTRSYLSEFRRVVFEYVVTESFPQATKDSILASTPFAVISVKDKDGKINEVKCFKRKAPTDQEELLEVDDEYDVDRLYALLNNNDFVLAQYFQFGRVLKTRDWFKRD